MSTTTAGTTAVTPVSEEHAVALRWHAEVFEGDRYEAVHDVCTPDFRWHNAGLPPELRTLEGTKQLARMMRAGFSDYRLPHIAGAPDLVAGDRVVTFWTFVGTHDGEFLGAAPTGRRVEVTGIDAFVVRDGRIAELRQEMDVLGWMRQIGLVP